MSNIFEAIAEVGDEIIYATRSSCYPHMTHARVVAVKQVDDWRPGPSLRVEVLAKPGRTPESPYIQWLPSPTYVVIKKGAQAA